MTFSIIIPTCNRNDLLELCLQRLAPGKQTLPANQYEVIVTDDGMGFPAETFCSDSFPFVHYIRGPQKGPAANRNQGARQARGNWLVFTDDDCLPDADWLQAYADAIQSNPECKAFEGAILPDDWELLKKDMAECPVNDKGGCFWSANVMIENLLFTQLNGFDETLKLAAYEDVEIYNRIKLKSEVPYIREAWVIHPVRFPALSQKVKRLPVLIDNWYSFENRTTKGWKVFWKGFKFHGHSLLLHVKQRQWKSSVFNVLVLCFLPFFILSQVVFFKK